VAGLTDLERALQEARDFRGLFVMAYVAMTNTIGQWIERGAFHDGAAMARYVVAFANEYRRALADGIAGERSRIPMAWRQSFDACEARAATAFQCLLLGINAHMNRDLPYAVVEAGMDVDSPHCYLDHVRIDDVLRLNMPAVRRGVAVAYGREFPLSQQLLGCFIETRLARRFEQARRNAWSHAQLLLHADTVAARADVEAMIERRAAIAGQRILGKRGGVPRLTGRERL
jgi:hypothetical protein